LSQFVAVVVTNHHPLAQLIEWDEFCRTKNILFILAQSTGAFTNMFSDFGDAHHITDQDGENVITHNIQSAVVKDEKLIVEVTADQHGLSDDDVVAISGCRGMELLNGKNASVKRVYNKRKTDDGKDREVLDLKRFSIAKLDGEDLDLASIKSEYTSGGIFSQVKPSKTLNFISLSKSLVNPKGEEPFLFHPDGFEAMMMEHRSENLHYARLGLWKFQDAHNGDLPRLHNKEDAAEVVTLAEAAHEEMKEKEGMVLEDGLDKAIITKAALYARAELLGLCTFLGGFAAQEVIKKWGKTTPVFQWQYTDFLSILSDEPSEDHAPEGSRYDHQISFFGKDFQKKLTNQKWFLVGCGALGCEYLKGFSLMGIGSGPEVSFTSPTMTTLSCPT
jgi:ubiquitin-activating enzyme E1